MKKFQSTLNCFYGVFIVIFGGFNSLLSFGGFHKFETGFFIWFYSFNRLSIYNSNEQNKHSI